MIEEIVTEGCVQGGSFVFELITGVPIGSSSSDEPEIVPNEISSEDLEERSKWVYEKSIQTETQTVLPDSFPNVPDELHTLGLKAKI